MKMAAARQVTNDTENLNSPEYSVVIFIYPNSTSVNSCRLFGGGLLKKSFSFFCVLKRLDAMLNLPNKL